MDLSATVTCAAAVTHECLRQDGKPVARARGGTLLYASPEQCRHLAGWPDIVELDGRSDIYSLGVVAFQMLSGELPSYPPPHPAGGAECAPEAAAAPAARRRRQESAAARGFRRPLPGKGPRPSVRRHRGSGGRTAADCRTAVARALDRPGGAARGRHRAGDAVAGASPRSIRRRRRCRPSVSRARAAGAAAGAGQPQDRDLASEVRIVGDVQTNVEVLPGFLARLVDDGARGIAVEIEAPRDVETVEQAVYLWVNGRRAQHSQSLRVAYLGASAWAVRSAGVPDLGDRVLDPRGASIEVRLRGDPACIAQVSVTHGDVARNAAPDAARSIGDDLYYTLPLDSFWVTRTWRG